MNVVNYQKELDTIINNMGEKRPTLLLHSCCAPCSSYCMEYLRDYFDITVFYYNPNISSDSEYRKRVKEEIRLIEAYNKQVDIFKKIFCDKNSPVCTFDISSEYGCESDVSARTIKFSGGMSVSDKTAKIKIIEGDYEPQLFFDIAKGYERCPEGGERCFRCFELRLKKSFEVAINNNMDYVTTTLTISPLKNATKINEIGFALAQKNSGVEEPKWLPSDFKKRNGYKRSIELSHEFDLYRQNFCGCAFSKAETQT